MRQALRNLLFPVRRALGRLVITPEQLAPTDSVVYKAASLIAAEKIPGDYLEFGVYRGDSFASAYRAIELAFRNASTPGPWSSEQDCQQRAAIWREMRFFAFDSFQGLPDLSNVDRFSNDFVPGKYSCSRDEFERNLERAGVPRERVVVVPGWFDETLTANRAEDESLQTAAIVYIDSDLYESAKRVLDFVTPLLTDGSVLVFDDWYCYRGSPDLGEQRACREWLEENPDINLTEYQKEGPWKNSFIVNRRGSGSRIPHFNERSLTRRTPAPEDASGDRDL